MIDEHNKMIKKHLGFEDGEKVSPELNEFMEQAEKIMSDGCCRNSFSRETIIMALALLKASDRADILKPVSVEKKEPLNIDTAPPATPKSSTKKGK